MLLKYLFHKKMKQSKQVRMGVIYQQT